MSGHLTTVRTAFEELIRFVWRARVKTNEGLEEVIVASESSEALVARPLPDLLEGLGKAVASANKELMQGGEDDTRMVIHSAEIELRIAVNMKKSSEAEIKGGAGIGAFSMNASYARTYNFSEESSSRILVKIAVAPPLPPST